MFSNSYLDWNHKRIKKIIAHYGHQAFSGKRILDLGCGHSDLGGALARLGAQVTAVDVRQEHLILAKKKYPHITTIKADLDHEFPFLKEKFDFVLALGIVCHLKNYKEFLEKVCRISDNIILESEICDSNDPSRVVTVSEHSSIYDWAINGVANKPSAPHVEQILRDLGMKFERIDDKDLNTGPYKYDWISSNSGNRKIGYRRLWFVKKGENSVIISPRKFDPPKVNPDPFIIQPEIIMSTDRKPKDSKFRVALCISGYMRGFEQTFPKLWTQLIKQVNPDIFIHTWEFLGSPLRGFDAPLVKIPTNSVLNKINKLYQPTKLVIEPAKKFALSPMLQNKNTEHRDINGLMSMFYKIKACNQLKLDVEKVNGFKYDCVIRLRSDLTFMSPFYINDKLNMDKLYIPKGYDYGGINDQVAFGSSSIMDIYSAAFDNVEKVLQSGHQLNPELILLKQIQNNNLPLERCNMHYYIRRAL